MAAIVHSATVLGKTKCVAIQLLGNFAIVVKFTLELPYCRIQAQTCKNKLGKIKDKCMKMKNELKTRIKLK